MDQLFLLLIYLFKFCSLGLRLIFCVDSSYKKAIAIIFHVLHLRMLPLIGQRFVIAGKNCIVVDVGDIVLHLGFVQYGGLIVLQDLHVVHVDFKVILNVGITVIIVVHIYD
jgi:hypothetical protein